MDTEKTQFFKSKYELDMKKLGEWSMASSRSVRVHTQEIRDHLKEMRDAEIVIHKKAGDSQREIANKVESTQKTVSNSLSKTGSLPKVLSGTDAPTQSPSASLKQQGCRKQ